MILIFTVQLPYIELVAPYSILHQIINFAALYIAANELAKYIAIIENAIESTGISQPVTDITNFMIKGFPSLNVEEQIGSLYFGINYELMADDMDSFLHYVFTNMLFDDIINIIDMNV